MGAARGARLVCLGAALLGCVPAEPARDPDPDGAPRDGAMDAARGLDATREALDLDCSLPRIRSVPDAHPASLVDAWVPDWGPVPDSLPPEMHWWHGRFPYDERTRRLCFDRPPRVLPDGSSECDYTEHHTPQEYGRLCRAWPYGHHTTDVEHGPTESEGEAGFVFCRKDYSLCCIAGGDALPPCGDWFVCGASYVGTRYPGYPDFEVWSNVEPATSEWEGSTCPAEVADRWRDALNQCHHLCSMTTRCPRRRLPLCVEGLPSCLWLTGQEREDCSARRGKWADR